jgi:hypothetical protein
MTIAPGSVFDLDPPADLGPWSAGRHPGLVVAVSEQGATLVPLSTSPPRGTDRGHGYELRDAGDVLSTPIWAHCHLPATFGRARLQKATFRGRLPSVELGPIRDRLARYLGLDP